MTQPQPIIPLISPIVTGPLGIMHLPRLWLKLLLFAEGMLAEGYRHGHGGLDEKLIKGIGIDVDAIIELVDKERPDYQAFEKWVEQNAKDLSPDSIAAVNEAVRNEQMPERIAVERRAQFGIEDPTYSQAVPLINLDDWAGTYAAIMSRR